MQSFAVMMRFFKDLWQEWNEDNAAQLAAGFAYYAVFSLSPLIVISMAIVSFFFERESAQGQLLAQIENLVGSNVTELIASILNSAATKNGGIIAGLFSAATLLWAGASLFSNLQNALNIIWDVSPPIHNSVMTFIRRRALSIFLVLLGGVVGLVSLLLTSIFSSLSHFVEMVGFNLALWDAIANLGLTFVVIAILFALIYKMLPDIVVPWRDAWLGAVVASLMFVIGKSLLGWYFAQNSTVSVYGAAGSLVALLLWIYYSSQIFFFGAEFSQVYSRRRLRQQETG